MKAKVDKESAVLLTVVVVSLTLFMWLIIDTYNLGKASATPAVVPTPPNTLIAVDSEAWAKTADTLARAYGKACNKALAINYGGDYGDTSQYTCVPLRHAVYLERNGKTVGEPIEVRMPWEGVW